MTARLLLVYHPVEGQARRLDSCRSPHSVIVGFIAGALACTRNGWFKRTLMKRVAASEHGDSDTSVDHEFTDWDAVDEFARDALRLGG